MELLAPSDRKEEYKQALRSKGRLKFVIVSDPQQKLHALFSLHENHDVIVATLMQKVHDSVFKGAGLANKDIVVWGSPKCMEMFGKDRPESVGLQNRVANELKEAIQKLLAGL